MTPVSSRSARLTILLILGLASVIKLEWATMSNGTCDLFFFLNFGRTLQTHPLEDLYRRWPLFNHTPLTGLCMKGLFSLVQDRSMGGGFEAFALVIRLASVLADMAMVLGLLAWREEWRGPPWWALAMFAASPVSIMVSGFHGNIDPLMTAALFFSVVAAGRNRPVLCGLLFALACNIKVMPILFSPLLFFYWLARGRRPAWEFFGVVCLAMLAGMGWALWRAPVEFCQHVLGYGSTWGTWGITYWLKLYGPASLEKMDYKDLSPLQNHLMTVLKMVISALVLWLGWNRRRVEGRGLFATFAAAYAVLFTFAPGVGVQYMVWSAPFLLLAEPGWYAGITIAATCYLAAFYGSCDSEFPWIYVIPKGPEIATWGPWANLPWLGFVALCVWFWRRRFFAPTPA